MLQGKTAPYGHTTYDLVDLDHGFGNRQVRAPWSVAQVKLWIHFQFRTSANRVLEQNEQPVHGHQHKTNLELPEPRMC